MSFISNYLISQKQIADLYEKIEVRLTAPDALAVKINRDKMNSKLKASSKMLKLVEKFIKVNEGILYGGLAMNSLLPKELRFYEDNELPDFDFFTINAGELSIKLSDHLQQHNFKYTEVKHAMHEGTYKVFTNFQDVADITQLSQAEYDIIFKMSIPTKVTYKTLRIAPIDFIKALAYLELCIPLGASFRWTKVYKRLLLFESAYPIEPTDNVEEEETLLDEMFIENELPAGKFHKLYKQIKSFVKYEERVLVNLEALRFYMKKTKQASVINIKTNIQFLSIDKDYDIENITKKIRAMKMEFKTETYCDFTSFLPKKHVIYVKEDTDSNFIKMVTIYEAQSHCFSYMKNRGSLYCSIYFLFYIYYFKRLLKGTTKCPQIDNTLFMLQRLTYDTENLSELLPLFTENCYGIEKTMSVIKKNIWDDNKKILFYRPS
jgi:hypothetical protein